MLGDCITPDGNPRDSCLNHNASFQSHYSSRDRVPSSYGLTTNSLSTNHDSSTPYAPHFSPHRENYKSSQYWVPSNRDSSPDSLNQLTRDGSSYLSRGGYNSHQASTHWTQQSLPEPSRRSLQDSSRSGTLYQSLRNPQYSPAPCVSAYTHDSTRQSSPNQPRRDRGKKSGTGGGRSTTKLATDMRRWGFLPCMHAPRVFFRVFPQVRTPLPLWQPQAGWAWYGA